MSFDTCPTKYNVGAANNFREKIISLDLNMKCKNTIIGF